jgi:hypothetical protein
VRVELTAVPPSTPLPAAHVLSKTFAELVGDDLGREISPQFGQEARPVRLLQPGAALVGKARAPRKNPTLSIDYGALEQRGRATPPLLDVRVRFESGRTLEQRHELDLRPRWHTLELPLEAEEGEALEVRIELVLVGDYVLAGIGTPRLSLLESAPRTVLLVTSDTHRGDHVEARGATRSTRQRCARSRRVASCSRTAGRRPTSRFLRTFRSSPASTRATRASTTTRRSSRRIPTCSPSVSATRAGTRSR